MRRGTQGVRATGDDDDDDGADKEQQQKQRGQQRAKKARAPLQIVRQTVPTELSTTLAQRLSSPQPQPQKPQKPQPQQKGAGGYDCMVCLAPVRPEDDIWTCHACWAVFHVRCVDRWAAAAASSQQSASDASAAAGAAQQLFVQLRGLAQSPPPRAQSQPQRAWRCPGCRALQADAPVASCFCGKCAHPQRLAHAAERPAHSCGQQCGRMREGTSCPHPCTLVCHPGPCPQCPALGPLRTCFCGKRTYRLRCGEEDGGSSCGAACGKALACGKHRCSEVCHAGPCPPCSERVQQTCFCGAVTEMRPCTNAADQRFSCGRPCPKTLACGFHPCPLTCHAGPCPSCSLLPDVVRFCPCGKTPLQELLISPRVVCTDPVPCCSKVCGKLLPCGHRCDAVCHHGPCPQCDAPTSVACRCGSTTRTVPCHEATELRERGEFFLCNRVCRARKNCRKHSCNQKCCPSLGNPRDPTGEHICKLVCGQMLSCGNHTCEHLCHSGPCPPCDKLILEPLSCRCGRTTLMPPFPCGTPPPECMEPCSLVRPCGHVDASPHRCHFGECPPCVALVDRVCAGGHELRRNVPCYRTVISCGRPCGKPLSCGQHACVAICHAGACPIPQPPPGAEATARPAVKDPSVLKPGSCGQLCGKKRPGCGHPCKAFCHPGEPCPLTPCAEKITVRCACGRRSVQVDCLSVGDTNDKERQLECDDECAALTRSRQLAIAFGIRPEGRTEVPAYGDFLLQFAAGRRDFVRKLERTLNEFLASDARSLPLKSMQGPERQFVHGLAKFYGMHAHSEGQEPSKYVLLTKTLDANVPNVLISAVAASVVPRSGAAEGGGGGGADSDDQSFVLKLSDRASLDGTAIQQLLRPYPCQLVWLDRRNALAVFKNEASLRAARAALVPLGIIESAF